ncbi:hypothetical protein BGW42_007674 [Actinomortierella wolfii]|nr:hypothetical protein BGW42_007674 [Actinomortierella wolfii]
MPLLDPILDSIPHTPEDRPTTPHGASAQKRWFSLLLDLLLDPTRWHKLGFAVQWAKWLEWEGSFELKSPTATHAPGIIFLPNPLQPLRLNRLLNRLDFGLVSVETLIGCYETGDWTVLLRADSFVSEEQQKQLQQDDQEVLQTLEQLSLLAIYLRHSRAILQPEQPIDAEAAKEDQQIQQLVESILTGKDPVDNSPSAPSHVPWREAFASKALRLLPHQHPLQPTQPSKATVFINELLELIRLDKLARDDWMSPFAAQLPVSWYSDEFLRTLIEMARQFLVTEGRDKVRVPLQVQGLASIATLWSFWMRKTGTDVTNVLGQEMIELMAKMMATPSLLEGAEARDLFVGCFSGLATGIDKWHELMQPQIAEGMAKGFERTRFVVAASEMDAIQASLATVLKSTEATAETIRQLTSAFISSFYGSVFHTTVSSSDGRKPSLFTRDVEEESEELFQIQRLFQYVVTTRAGLSVTKDKDGDEGDANKKQQRKKQKPRKPVKLSGQEWWTALVGGLQDATDEKSAIPLLLATAGVLRAIQHIEDDPPRVDNESLGLIEDFYVGQLVKVLERVQQGSFFSASALNALAFACSQTIPNLVPCKVKSMSGLERGTLARILGSLMYSLYDGIVPVDALLRTVDAELSIRHKLTCSPDGPAIEWMNKITKASSLYKEMGRLARTTASLVESVQDVQEWRDWVMDLLKSIHAFAVHIHVVWAQSSLSRLPSAGYHPDTEDSKREKLTDSQQKEAKLVTGLMFQIFKTILFATVMILGAITETSGKAESHVNAALLETLDGTMLDTFGYLYFVTYAMGPGAFVVYEELMTTLLMRRVTINPALLLAPSREEQAQIDAGVPTERIYYGALNRWLCATMPRGDLIAGDPVGETRVLYFMNLVERVMLAVDEDLLRTQILPLVYPYLIRNEHRDLFESAHSVILSVLLTKRGTAATVAAGDSPGSISRELAPYYGRLLLNHYPSEINVDQLRAGYTTLVKALSEIDDGLAWLTVERLLERIREYDDVLVASSAQEEAKEEYEEKVVEALSEVHQELGPTDNPSHLPAPQTHGGSGASRPHRGGGDEHGHGTMSSARRLERVKERGELILALLDQLTSVNLIFVESLGEQIKTLLSQEPSVQSRRALLKCVLDVIGSQGVDQTKREWAVKWYLGLVQDLGQEEAKKAKKKKDVARSMVNTEQAVEARK